jgi:FkbM family methyltransferase
MNEWLTPVVEAYKHHFGEARKPVVWEVGSRDGDDAYELMRRIAAGWRAEENSTVVCLEPNPAQADIIRRNYPQAIVYELAAGDETRKAKFKVYHGNEGDVGSSSLHMDWKKGSGLKSHIIEVNVVRLDSLLGNEIIDVMKIDVEGYGYQALKGLGDKLNQVRVLHVETEHESKSDIKVRKYLEERGWELVDEREQWGSMPDLTFVNKNLV